MRRRTVLARGATALAAAIAGCTTFATDPDAGVTLTHVELGNATNQAQAFDVLVVVDDEIVHWAVHEVDAADADGEQDGAVIPIGVPDGRGDVEVRVRVGEVWQSTDFGTDEYAGERVIAVVTYGMVEDEMLRVSRRHSDRPSPDG